MPIARHGAALNSCQLVFGFGMPSLAVNCASSWEDNPIDTTDRSNSASVR